MSKSVPKSWVRASMGRTVYSYQPQRPSESLCHVVELPDSKRGQYSAGVFMFDAGSDWMIPVILTNGAAYYVDHQATSGILLRECGVREGHKIGFPLSAKPFALDTRQLSNCDPLTGASSKRPLTPEDYVEKVRQMREWIMMVIDRINSYDNEMGNG